MGRVCAVLQTIQPSSGGFLEAVPLTSFVLMSLASIGHANHPVAVLGRKFLRLLCSPWKLADRLEFVLWVTTLSVNAGGLETACRFVPITESHADDEMLCNWILAAEQGTPSLHGSRTGLLGLDPFARQRT